MGRRVHSKTDFQVSLSTKPSTTCGRTSVCEEGRMAPNLCIRYPASGAERRKRNQCQEMSRTTGMKEVAMISGRTHCRHKTHKHIVIKRTVK